MDAGSATCNEVGHQPGSQQQQQQQQPKVSSNPPLYPNSVDKCDLANGQPPALSAGPPVSDEGTEQNCKSFSSADALTVSGLSKVEAEFPAQGDESQGASTWVTLVRWLVMIILCLGFLTCLVASKMSSLSLGQWMSFYRNSSTHDKSTNHSGRKWTVEQGKERGRHPLDQQVRVGGMESSFLWIILVLLLPNVATLILSLWKGACRRDRPWPAWSSIMWGFCSSVVESFALILFTMEVMSKTPMGIVVSLMNGVFSIPLLFQLFQICTDRSGPRNFWQFALLGLGFLFEIAGIVLTVCIVILPFGLKVGITDVWEIPVALLLLSFTWSPFLQKRLLYPRQEQLELLWRKKRLRGNYDIHNAANVIFVHPELSARWKNSAIMCLTKLVLIPAIGLLYVYIRGMIVFSYFQQGFLNLNPSHPMFTSFMVNIFSSLIGSVLGVMACTMCMQKLSFAVPLILATPISCVLVVLQERCILPGWKAPNGFCGSSIESELLFFVVPAALCLVLAQIFSTAVFIFKTQTIVMQKSSHLFWLPGYNGIFLEQFFLLGRKNIQTNDTQFDPVARARDSHVIICTTMYREAVHEMEQLLRSIKAVNRAKQLGDRRFETHIFFDNGTRGTRLTEFALQLACIVKKTLDVESSQCTKVLMPYGIRLTWKLPTVVEGKHGMFFVIHLKDNLKVKNKKRWSQVMYMSYVIDYFLREETTATLDNTFILTTDADVKFTPESVEALLDLMMRDDDVGAVCSRTFPLGSGPVYWFQIFDYAIGHWLQKAANHVLGSVLCCPGCFSVYRVNAVKDVLPIYGSQVEKAIEFLTKDMGEDRWLCTLMVQSGWRLEYCAAASNSTYCPEDFDEFFKQRRRWIPSTLANLVLLLQEWKTISYFNKNISIFFMFYQALLLFSSLVNPAVSILVIVGGLQFAWSTNPIVSIVIMIIITVAYTSICLYCSQDNQLLVAKILTCLFAIIMGAVVIGTIAQIVESELPQPLPDFTTTPASTPRYPNATTKKSMLWLGNNGPLMVTPPSSRCDSGIWIPLSVTTLYLAGLVGIFLVTAAMHLPEAYCLVHGAWYLFCLPAGNLLLMIYSICNITDRSWGTREEKKVTGFDPSSSWANNLKQIFKKIFFCFKFDTDGVTVTTSNKVTQTDAGDSAKAEEDDFSDSATGEDGIGGSSADVTGGTTVRSATRKTGSALFRFATIHSSKHLSVRDWLPPNLKGLYSEVFEANGYDDTSFLVGMTDAELFDIGVSATGHRSALLQAIRLLPEVEIEPRVPKDISEWLRKIGLSMYTSRFLQSHIISPSNMEILKSMSTSPKQIEKELGIVKRGHLKRLLIAINRLRYPTQTEMQAAETRRELEDLRLFNLKLISSSEFEFWEKLRLEKLLPDSGVFAQDADLKTKLEDLRNSSLLVFAVANVIWLILIMTLATKSKSLDVLCTNPLGLVFLVIFGCLTFIQFLSMIFHRLSTWMHMVARAPDKCGQPNNASWAFKDSDFSQVHDDDRDIEARLECEEANRRIQEQNHQRVLRRCTSGDRDTDRQTNIERQPLISRDNSFAVMSHSSLSPYYSSENVLI